MPDLKVGYDYHLAEVHTTRHVYHRQSYGVTHQARCEACGWVGHVRDIKGAAEDDAAAHDNAENE